MARIIPQTVATGGRDRHPEQHSRHCGGQHGHGALPLSQEVRMDRAGRTPPHPTSGQRQSFTKLEREHVSEVK